MGYLISIGIYFLATLINWIFDSTMIAYTLACCFCESGTDEAAILTGLFSGLITVIIYLAAFYFERKLAKKRKSQKVQNAVKMTNDYLGYSNDDGALYTPFNIDAKTLIPNEATPEEAILEDTISSDTVTQIDVKKEPDTPSDDISILNSSVAVIRDNAESNNYAQTDLKQWNAPEISDDEFSIIKKYRTLDKYGRKNVEIILDNEYLRCIDHSETVRPRT